MFSVSEMLLIGVLALVLIGPKQLPEVARTLGRFLNELRRSANIFTADLKDHVRMDEEPPKQHEILTKPDETPKA